MKDNKSIIEDNNKLLVSICCLTYNHELFIRQCIEGFMIQKTNFKFEVLIHDDASLDNTANIIKEYEHKYPDIIKPIYQTENQYSKGVSLSSRYNWSRSKGKYIAMCEGDDYWIDPLKLQKQVDFLEKNKDYALVHTNFRTIKNNFVEKNHNRKVLISEGMVKEALLRENFIATVTVCFNKEKFDLAYNQIDKKYLMGDYPAWLAVALNSKIGYLNEVTSVYRVLENSASHSVNKLKQFGFVKSIFEMKFDFIDKHNFSKDSIKYVNESYCEQLFKYSVLLNESNIINEFKTFTKNKFSLKIIFYKFFFLFRRARLLKKLIMSLTKR